MTNLTQKWVNGTATNYGVILWATNENTNGYDLRFRSSEYADTTSHRPVLEVIYSTDAATKTVYFLKDHLGSIRATVLDSATAPVRGYDDYDPWGYPLVGRTKKTPYDSLQKIAKNKFTGKEWDDEFGLKKFGFSLSLTDFFIYRFDSSPCQRTPPNLRPYESKTLFWQSETSTLPSWKSWNLTNLTQKWVSGTATNYGVILWATTEDVNGYDLRFYSSEAAQDRPN